MTLQYRCPAQHYGCQCAGAGRCDVGKAVRILLDDDRRVFTPLARSSPKWESCYDLMSTRRTLALTVLLAMAVGRIKANQAEAMRSLLKAD